MSIIESRYVVIGTDVYDCEMDRVARFQNAGVAQIGADWLNTPDATPEDYEWTVAADETADGGVALEDLFRCADVLRVDPSELIGALAPLWLAERDRQKAAKAKA